MAIFGCDIGNAYGYISVLYDYEGEPEGSFEPSLSISGKGMSTSAYIVPPSGDEIAVFDTKPVYLRHKHETDNIVHAVKTKLGTSKNIYNKEISMYDVYAAVARDLIVLGNKQRINAHREPIYDIVFTYPVSLHEHIDKVNQMQKSISNLVIDGHPVNVVDRIPEPAAAAIDYLHYKIGLDKKANKEIKDSYTSIVYDLGYGTFDAALVTAYTNPKNNVLYDLHYSGGRSNIGGINFDQIIIDEIKRYIQNKTGKGVAPKNEEMVRAAAIEAKEELSQSPSAVVELELGDDLIQMEIKRDWFEKRCEAMIGNTLEEVEILLEKANKDKLSIDSVVLTGGASQMPMIEAAIIEMLENQNIEVVPFRPHCSVSYGAARYAYIADHFRKFTEFDYGIQFPPNENAFAGDVKKFVNSKESVPVASKTVSVNSRDFMENGRMRLRTYRTRKDEVGKLKNKDGDYLPIDECEAVMFFAFDVKDNTKCDVSLEVMEDYNVKVTVKPENGNEMVMTTRDNYI